MSFKNIFHLPYVFCLDPLQVRVGVLNGCEVIVHAINTIQADNSCLSNCKWALQVDILNAFNLIDLNHIFSVIHAFLPSLSAWLECCYGSQLPLLFSNYFILSCCGVQQGDPLDALALPWHFIPLWIKSREKVLIFINAWYLDEGTLCGSRDDLFHALCTIGADGPSAGLHLYWSKCLFISRVEDILLTLFHLKFLLSGMASSFSALHLAPLPFALLLLLTR